jgi:hypothetical protein
MSITALNLQLADRTKLAIGAVADGEMLVRSGTGVVGTTAVTAIPDGDLPAAKIDPTELAALIEGMITAGTIRLILKSPDLTEYQLAVANGGSPATTTPA